MVVSLGQKGEAKQGGLVTEEDIASPQLQNLR